MTYNGFIGGNKFMLNLRLLSEFVFQGNVSKVKEMIEKAIVEKIEPEDILKKGLLEGMNHVGICFKNNEIFLPEVLMSSQAMTAGMEILQPLLIKTGVKSFGKVLIGTVKGDLHDIGKNLVVMMLKGGGFEVLDLGIDISPEKFLDAAKEYHPDIIGLSALLTTTMASMKDTIVVLEKAGIRNKLKVMIGGTAVTQNYAEEIGADGYAPDAASAVDMAKGFLTEKYNFIERRVEKC